MELENKDILKRNVSEKMCSLGSNGAGEICSPETADTCGDGSTAFPQRKCQIVIPEFWNLYGTDVKGEI